MDESIKKPTLPPEHSVAIWCPADRLGEFITGLLGKPQTIEHPLSGNFIVDRNHLLGLHHLIEQRVNDQNEAQLVQFVASIGYENGLSVEIGSLHEFQNYAEVRALVTRYISLSWVYLLKFRGRETLERQQIEIIFSTEAGGTRILRESNQILSWNIIKPESGVLIRVSHTMRSWGMDLESLLTDHLKGLLDEKQSGLPRLLSAFSGVFALLTFVSVASVLLAVGVHALRFITRGYEVVNLNQNAPLADLVRVSARKIDLLYSFIGGGRGLTMGILVVLYVVVAMAVAVSAAVMTSSNASEAHPSFILFTANDLIHKERVLQKYKVRWQVTAVGIFVSVLGGVLANVVTVLLW